MALTMPALLLRLASMSTKWRRRRRRKQQNNDALLATAYSRASNDNCNYTTTNNVNKINKLLLITCILLITTTTICQSLVVVAAAAAVPSLESAQADDANEDASSNLPLSLLLKSGAYNPSAQRQVQRELFALITKNNRNIGVDNKPIGINQAVSPQQHFRRDTDFDERDANAEADFTASHVPRDIALTAAAPSSASLETNGFVADDGGQYEQAERALSEAVASSAGGGNNNNNCPKECKCLNVLFDCDKLHLERVPQLPNFVQTLHLANNKLNDSSVLDIRNLPELHKLTLKRNQLEAVPKFTGLVALKQLNLANNRIQRISSAALAALPKLKSLDLSRNQLHSVEANCFPKPNRLAHLILNSNEIASIDEQAFAALNDLTDLDLNNNRLHGLPVGVFKSLGRLKKLGLNNNYLEINWSTFRGLTSLQRLHLRSNNIRALQDGVFHVMRNIETIELDHNGITSLARQGLFNLTKLRYLSLSNNSISRIELDTWEFTQSLEYLDLAYNNISEFKPQHLDCLRSLKQLNLAHNKLQYLQDNTFDCVKNLEDLNLRRNSLAWIIEEQTAVPPFKGLRKLRKLDLFGNNLKQISSKSLSGLNNLELLNLGGNALATIQPNAFEHMQRLQKIIFKSLNFICDCDLLWFRNWLSNRFPSQTQQLHAQAVCGHPDHLLDRELLTLSDGELVCADSPKPAIIQEPTNMLAVKGANITLECIANSPASASLAAADELKIKWRHDNQHVQELIAPHDSSKTETQIHHDQNNNQTTIYGYLRLSNVTYESAGRYQCVVSNAFGTTYAQKFKISIGIHPSFLHVPSNLTIDSGETARLVCSAIGDPMPEIGLQKFGGKDFPAATERRLQVIREENAFLITNAKPSDTGIYTCTADSAAGEIKINATLLVNDKPQPSIPAVHKEVVVGRTCVLECLSKTANTELDQPHREWFKENKPFHISPTTHDSERYFFADNKELLIILQTQSNDAGHYRCEITDNTRTLTLQSELVVVKDSLSWNTLLTGIVVLPLTCALVGVCVIWCTLRYQKRKLQATARVNASQNMLSESRASALDQTQLTTLNRTQLRPHQSQNVLDGISSALPLEQQQQMRPRSLADLASGSADGQTRSRLIVTTTPSFGQRGIDEGLTLTFLQDGDLVEQQDHLSSKDSGTGSDAAVKRSLEDFPMALLHTPNTAMTRRRQPQQLQQETKLKKSHDDVNDEDDNDNELQFAHTRALGISEYEDDIQAYEEELFLQNNNLNYDNINGLTTGVATGPGATVATPAVAVSPAVATPLPPPVMPRKCSTQLSSNSSYNNVKQSATVDI